MHKYNRPFELLVHSLNNERRHSEIVNVYESYLSEAKIKEIPRLNLLAKSLYLIVREIYRILKKIIFCICQ